jgi:hypothetical protein
MLAHSTLTKVECKKFGLLSKNLINSERNLT